MNGHKKNRGVISAGHELTARTGAMMLENGGNAFDAAVAASFTAFVCEPLLTSPGGGGFMMAHTDTGATTLYDFFTDIPGRGKGGRAHETRFFPVDINFVGAVQELYLGEGSVAVPGIMAGLDLVYKKHCTLPIDMLIAPSIEHAKAGIKLGYYANQFMQTLEPMLELTQEGRDLFFYESGELLKEKELFRNPELASFLGHLSDTASRAESASRGSGGLQDFYTGDIADTIARAFGPPNGLITREDLSSYRVIERTPLRVEYRGRQIYTNPPPSSGGALVAFALKLLQGGGIDPAKSPHNGYENLKTLYDVMQATDRAREREFNHKVHDEAEATSFLSEAVVERYRNELCMEDVVKTGIGNTTHISVVDERGNAAAITTSTGIGSGFFVPGTGFLMNNMLGEEDLNPKGFHVQRPGTRLSSMMAPTIVMQGEKPEAVIGTGGSKRIRSAILQTILNLVDHSLSVDRAVNRPRVHFDGEFFQLEKGVQEKDIMRLRQAGVPVRAWDMRHMYFGGVHGVGRDKGGGFTGAGDSRRGGVAIKVD